MKTTRSLGRIFATLLLASGLAAAGCGGGEESQSKTDAAGQTSSHAIDYDGPMIDPEVAVISVEGVGEMVVELLPGKAPGTVENFKKLAREGFYDGTTFHRIVPGFMIQGGDPNSKDRDPRNDGRGGPGYQIKAEFNDINHVRGTLSMARSSSPDSAGSQFFVVVDDSPHLDGSYTAFGRVLSGIEVADQVVAVPRDKFGRHGPRDRPLEDVKMTIRLEPASAPEAEEAADPGAGAGAGAEAGSGA